MKNFCRKLSITLFAVMAAMIIVAFPRISDAHAYDEAGIIQQIKDTYSDVKKRSGIKSFDGNCGKYVNWQMVSLGINKSYVSGNGNQEYDNYRKLSNSTGGYKIEAFSGSKYTLKSALNALTDNGNENVYNILVGFEKGSSKSSGQTYGHTFFIHAIIGGTVYYSESFGDSYGKEGAPRKCSISELADRYKGKNTFVLDGIIHFYKNEISSSRIYGANRVFTSVECANQLRSTLGGSKFDSVIVACGEKYPDALTGSYLAVCKKAPVYLISSSKKQDGDYVSFYAVKNSIRDNLKAGGTIYVLGGDASVPEDMLTELSQYGNVERLGGETRLETNLKILECAGIKNSSELIVCSGENYADALSASATGRPILLVTQDGLTFEQKDFLASHTFFKIYVFGGTNAVSEAVFNSLKSYSTVTRIYGDTRFETTLQVAKKFFPKASAAMVTTGYSFPDGLSGGCLAHYKNVPLILVGPAGTIGVNQSVYLRDNKITNLTILGGESAVSPSTVNTLTR